MDTITTLSLEHETGIRLGVFIGVFTIMALWELAAPRRRLSTSKVLRWSSNLTLVVLNTIVVRIVFPTVAVGMALMAQQRGWGVFNNFDVPGWLVFVLAVAWLDFVIYLQHVMVHAVPALWRLHRVHHADMDFDVTTGSRFHPLEIILSMLLKFAAIVVIGAPPFAVLVFEVLLNASAMFNHSNVAMPAGLDRVLRWFIVTPDMHRVHHSIEDYETNSNFGFNLPWWDRLFGTYKAQPDAGHQGMTIGIRSFRDGRKTGNLGFMLLIPFIGKIDNYSINRREWKKNP